MQSIRRFLLAFALLFLGGSEMAQAAGIRALLVGASAYPELPPPESTETPRQLLGPRNDVRLMSEVLERLGVLRSQQIILADGLAGANGNPRRESIDAAIDQLLRTSAAGDFVVLYFSGHGSREPAPVSVAHPAGFREIFLPLDVGRWNGKTQAVDNAIADDQFVSWRDAFGARGVTVWALFDTCHAGTMFRGLTDPKDAETTRYIPAAALGVPPYATSNATSSAATAAIPARAGARWIAFYASREDESAPELDLPIGAPNPVRHGLFTYTVAQALSHGGLTTYRDLRQRVLYSYAQLGRLAPNPDADGDLDLALPLISTTATVRTDSYLMRREGARWRVEAGRLHGLRDGQSLSLSIDAAGGNGELQPVGTGHVESLGNVSSLVEIDTAPGLPSGRGCASARSTPDTARLQAAQVLWAMPCDGNRLAVQLAELRKCPLEPESASAAAHCPAVNPDTLEPLGLAFLEQYFLSARSEAAVNPNIAPVLTPTGVTLFPLTAFAGGRPFKPTRLNRNAADAAATFFALERRMILTERLAALASDSFGAPAGVEIEVGAGPSGRDGSCSGSLPKLPVDDVRPLAAGSRLAVRVFNAADRPADLLLIAVGPEDNATVLYPGEPTENNRLAPNARLSLCFKIDDSGPAGQNWLFAIMAPVDRPLTPRLDMESLYPPSYRARGMASPRSLAPGSNEAGVEVFRWTQTR